MKRKTLMALFCVFILIYTHGQKISNIDFDFINTKIKDSTSTFFYPLLINRFVKVDTTLTEKEYELIYYGNTYSEKYKPYSTSEAEKKFFELYRQEKYKEAIPFGKEVLKENPINLKISFRMLVCFNVLGDKITAKHYANRYFPLLNCIYNSGDGKSIQTAFVVLKVDDEYEILDDLGLSSKGQALVGDTDVLTIDKKNQKVKKGEKKISSLYFNVTKPLDYLQQEFRKNK